MLEVHTIYPRSYLIREVDGVSMQGRHDKDQSGLVRILALLLGRAGPASCQAGPMATELRLASRRQTCTAC